MYQVWCWVSPLTSSSCAQHRRLEQVRNRLLSRTTGRRDSVISGATECVLCRLGSCSVRGNHDVLMNLMGKDQAQTQVDDIRHVPPHNFAG